MKLSFTQKSLQALYKPLNSDTTSNVCNHFVTLFDDGTGDDDMTFLKQFPDNDVATAHVIPYDWNPQAPKFGVYAGSFTFVELIYPTLLSGREFMFLSKTEYYNTLIYYPYDVTVPDSGELAESTVVSYLDTGKSVEFNKIYQTPEGSMNILYGYDSIYWFTNNGSITTGNTVVSGKVFNKDIQWVVATPDDLFILTQDTHGIWVYSPDFNQLHCSFSWLNQTDEVLWIEVKLESST